MGFLKTILAFGLATATVSFADKYEAESATLSGTAEKVTSENASGGAYVDQKEGDIEFSVTAEAAGKFLLTIHYKAGDFKSNYITVNGDQVGQIDFNAASTFTDISTIVTLKAGANTVGIKKFWGWISVDYINLEPYTSKPFALCNAPITPDATPEAVKLYNFLVNNFGKKTISGIMTGDMEGYDASKEVTTHPDVQDIYTRSGKYPALVGVDFLFANGPNATNSWNKGYTEKALALAKDLWSKGGIPAFTWHWKDPSDSVDAFYANQNAAGEGKAYTTFDFTQAFMTGTTTWDTLSAAYKGIIADIDDIANYFLALQSENVAAIFRPLHEAGGTWFWWSTRTGKQFAALYRLVYERMVFTKGVKNLVWVFNPSSTSLTDWNPGETYYDVLSIDIYNDDNVHSSNSAAFDDFKTKWGLSKVLALSENGPIPDVNNMHTDEAVWSWWMPWYGTWSGKWPGQTKNEVWKSNMEDERIITLDKMPGWASYSEANSGTGTCQVAKATSTFNGDPEKAAGNKKEDKMVVTYALGKDGALINTTKLPDLTKAKTLSVDISVDGTGAAEGGVWIGLAFVRNGMADSAWTWEQSPSDGCWMEEGGGSKTCTFDITLYKDDAGTEHPIDLDNLFSLVFVASAEGFNGTVTFDNLIADDGTVVTTFDDAKSLFSVSEGSEKTVKSIKLESEGTNAIKTVAASAAKFGIQGNMISLTTAKSGLVSVDVFGMNGKRVATLYKGNLAAGSYAFSLADMPKGRYIVRVKGAGIAATKPILVK